MANVCTPVWEMRKAHLLFNGIPEIPHEATRRRTEIWKQGKERMELFFSDYIIEIK